MNNRERLLAVLNYQDYDCLPVVHFGFWRETLEKWADEGHISRQLARDWEDGSASDNVIGELLGFDFNYFTCVHSNAGLQPCFEEKILQELPDGSRHILNHDGVVTLCSPDAGSIPAEISHTLVDRKSWEEHYRHRYQWCIERVTAAYVKMDSCRYLRWDEGGIDFLRGDSRDFPLGFHVGSLYGHFRNVIGVVGSSYMLIDDPELFGEILQTIADISYRNLEYALSAGAKFDFVHFWEDICFKNGPLINPAVFNEYCGPAYRRISELAKSYGIDIVSVDCDGVIDALLPCWLENGVNTMFPIEVGTWNANIVPWRKKYGQNLRGVGGMNKTVFSQNYDAVDMEIERLKSLISLGGYLPCPDHRISPDAKWENVQYYCEQMHKIHNRQ